MTLTFHIIYMPGIVRYMTLFLFSLLKWSDCSFRLVSNGCSPHELRHLRKLSDNSSRLELVVLPDNRLIRHGRALSYLWSLERADHFCFMDSDVLATGEFLGELAPELSHHAGVFSGSPIWCSDEEQILPERFQRMAGRYNRSAMGVCLGSTYVAMYDNRVLRSLIPSSRIDFRRYSWGEIPAEYQNQIANLGLKKRRYDTAKVLNLLLLAQGRGIIFKEVSSLHHIGGIDTGIAREGDLFGIHADSVQKVPHSLRRRLRRRVIGLPGFQRLSWARTEQKLISAKAEKKHVTCRYFRQLLDALCEGRPRPSLPMLGDSGIGERVQFVTESIVKLHEEFGDRLTA